MHDVPLQNLFPSFGVYGLPYPDRNHLAGRTDSCAEHLCRQRRCNLRNSNAMKIYIRKSPIILH
jgi:hypothetical protein